MKKTLALALAFVLMLSCVFTGISFISAPADAQTPAGMNAVSASVREQNGKFGGALLCDAVQYIPEGELATVSATPYYGNGFVGWYEGTELVSKELNYSFAPTRDIELTAVFDIRNMVENGNAEVVSGQNVLTDSINNAKKYHTSYFGTATVVPTAELENTDEDYGSYALMLDPSQVTGTTAAAKVKNLANFSIKVKKNTDYIIRFSYKFDDNAAFTPSGLSYALYMSLNGPDANGKIPYDDTNHTIKWAYHSQQDGTEPNSSSTKFTTVWSWGGSNGYNAADEGCDKYFTDNGVSSAKVWQNVYLVFNPGEDADVFRDGDEGTVFFSLGTHYNTTDFALLDNLLIAEAEANAKSTVSAGKNGSVKGTSPRTDENYYTYTEGKRGDSDVFTNRDTSKLYYPTAYEQFVATEADGAEFVGWFDENGECVSRSKVAYLLMTGKTYTARFATDISAEGGGCIIDNGDGTYTAKAYYGNKFLGWYDGTTDPYTFKTAEPTLEKEGHLGYVALFTENNLIYDGDFEVNNKTANVYNDYLDYDAAHAGVNSVVPTCIAGSGPEFGENCLQIVPHQSSHAARRKGLVNIPVQLENGKTYIWKFSYAIQAASYTANRDYLMLSVDPADANGKVPWTSDGGTKYSYHVQLASHNGVNTNNYAWGDWTSDAKTHYSCTTAISTANAWVDVFVIFTAEADGTHFLSLGCNDNQTNTFFFDNMSCSEAKTGVASLVSVSAGANGKVHSYRTAEAAYVTDAPRGTANIYANHVDTDNPYYSEMYVDFFASPDVGFVFDGWYDDQNQLVTKDETLRVLLISDEVYTAKFIADPNKYSATASIEEKGGVMGGYIEGATSYTQVGSGEQVSFTAKAYKGNTFEGWYVGDAKVSSDETISYTVRKDVVLVAKFEIGNVWADSGYENLNLGDKVGVADVVGNEAASGKQSLMISSSGIYESEKAAVSANTDYVLSLMWKSAAGGNTRMHRIKLLDENGATIIGKIVSADATGEWIKHNIAFSSGAATAVSVKLEYSGTEPIVLYLDDIVLCNALISDFTVTAGVEQQNGIYGGYIEGAKEVTARYGTNVTVKAVAYERNTFLGWYDGDTLLSTDAEYTFPIDGFRDLKARFTINNLWPDSGYENTQKDISLSENGDWSVHEGLHQNYGFDVTVTDQGSVWSGKQMLKALHRGNTFSTVISGLEENENYFLTFRVRTHKTLDNCYFQEAKVIGTYDDAVLGNGFGTANGGQWEYISVPFSSGKNTSVRIELVYQAGEESCYFDDFALFKSNNIGVYAGDGGTVQSTLNGGENGPATTGTSVTVTATPNSGNTFLGWYDYEDSSKLISSANPYTFEVQDSRHIFAKFAGPGVEPENKIVDGDFENGCFKGFIFSGTTIDANCAFCTYQVTKKVGNIEPVSGDYMVKLAANSRTSSLLVNNLKPNTDYTVSFYWLGNEFINVSYVAAYKYQAEFGYELDQTTKLNKQNLILRYNQTDMRAKAANYVSPLGDGDGKNWRQVEFSFNSGNRSEALIAINYSRNGGTDGLYLDNIKVTEGSIYSDGIENGDFSAANTEKGWHGDYVAENGAAKTDSVIYNGTSLIPHKGYTLTFKARSDSAAEIIYGLAESGAKQLSSGGKTTSYSGVSYDTVALTSEWREYEVSFLASSYPQAAVVFQSLSGGEFMIDDVKLSRAEKLVPVDKLTFDSTELCDIVNASFESILSPNAHKNPKNPDWFSYSSDAHSGDGALLMKGGDYAYHPLSQTWAEFDLESGRSYRVTFYAKASQAGAKFTSGIVYTDPKYQILRPADKTFELNSTDWQKFSFTFTVEDIIYAGLGRATFFVDGVEGVNCGDILFDDVYIEEFTNSVTNTDADKLYTFDISQNYFPNYSFEKDGDAAENFIVSGDASFGDRYVSLKAGDKIIIPVTTRTDYDLARSCVYTFAADVRGDAQSQGTIGLSYSADGKSLMTDAEGNVVTLGLNTNGKWLRQGFSFAGNRNETEYLVIECTAGKFDVDYVALFNKTHEFAECTLDTSKPLSKEEISISDMSGTGISNYITGIITGLPEGSKVVLEGNRGYEATIIGGEYRIDGIRNGTYQMYVAPAGADIMTLWGEITFKNGSVSGLAVERLSGNAMAIENRGVANGIVKILDTNTGYAYLTATDAEGNYTAYILDCSWMVEGTTADPEALAAEGLTLEQFGATAGDSEEEEEQAGNTITKITKIKGKKADNTIPYILFALAGVIALAAVTALIVLNVKKGGRK
ncbi:MAG: carbohydrate binding domain-containing protein [Clostridia bacterium]|nr:carbohydrate binding domain-containing protein [Clostridia bacterium]